MKAGVMGGFLSRKSNVRGHGGIMGVNGQTGCSSIVTIEWGLYLAQVPGITKDVRPRPINRQTTVCRYRGNTFCEVAAVRALAIVKTRVEKHAIFDFEASAPGSPV